MNAEGYFRQLSPADIEGVMDVCEKLHRTEPGESFIRHSCTTINQAFENVCFSVEVYHLKPFRLREQKIHTPDYDYWISLFKEHILDRPDRQRFIVVMDSDRGMRSLKFTLKEFHYSILYTDLYDQVQAPCQLWIGIRDGNELLNCIYSRERDCTKEELAMMCLIQSNLESAWKYRKQVLALKQELDLLKNTIFQSEEEKTVATQIRKSIESLTRRQRDVVKQVASGKDNQQVAAELKISVWTVKTHLKVIFRLLDVQHRTELVANWNAAYFTHIP